MSKSAKVVLGSSAVSVATGHQQTLALSFNSLVGSSKERGGTSSSTALSAFRLIPSSTLVGCDNGKSSGLRRSVLDDGQRTPNLVRTNGAAL